MKPIANSVFFAQIEELIDSGEEVQLRIKGGSMRPWLRDGRSTVVLRRHKDEELRPGAIVLFRCGGRHILHRIIRRDGERLTLAGDGNYRTEEHCTTKDVAAIAWASVSRSGDIRPFDSPLWRMRMRLWLALPALVRRYILAVLRRAGLK